MVCSHLPEALFAISFFSFFQVGPDILGTQHGEQDGHPCREVRENHPEGPELQMYTVFKKSLFG